MYHLCTARADSRRKADVERLVVPIPVWPESALFQETSPSRLRLFQFQLIKWRRGWWVINATEKFKPGSIDD
ncbi:hypothetical protein X743_10170 [Mesorhizobium sp. LNHC252B00]|nr:hypothetical protein X743_10170 [Mesorhizobium sp. LNHC252B00]